MYVNAERWKKVPAGLHTLFNCKKNYHEYELPSIYLTNHTVKTYQNNRKKHSLEYQSSQLR